MLVVKEGLTLAVAWLCVDEIAAMLASKGGGVIHVISDGGIVSGGVMALRSG